MFAKRTRRRLVSILVIVALLWTQVVLAAHGLCAPHIPAADCEAATVTTRQIGAQVATVGMDSMMDASCAAHCSRDDTSPDVSRIPPLPVMLPVAFGWADLYPVIVMGSGGHVDAEDPACNPRGPTGHPAGVLLI
ncbi:MAG: hypothetical protein ACOY37_09570 [Pseudomonadota bacterium]